MARTRKAERRRECWEHIARKWNYLFAGGAEDPAIRAAIDGQGILVVQLLRDSGRCKTKRSARALARELTTMAFVHVMALNGDPLAQEVCDTETVGAWMKNPTMKSSKP